MTNSEPLAMLVGQRVVMVLSCVKNRTPSAPCICDRRTANASSRRSYYATGTGIGTLMPTMPTLIMREVTCHVAVLGEDRVPLPYSWSLIIRAAFA